MGRKPNLQVRCQVLECLLPENGIRPEVNLGELRVLTKLSVSWMNMLLGKMRSEQLVVKVGTGKWQITEQGERFYAENSSGMATARPADTSAPARGASVADADYAEVDDDPGADFSGDVGTNARVPTDHISRPLAPLGDLKLSPPRTASEMRAHAKQHNSNGVVAPDDDEEVDELPLDGDMNDPAPQGDRSPSKSHQPSVSLQAQSSASSEWPPRPKTGTLASRVFIYVRVAAWTATSEEVFQYCRKKDVAVSWETVMEVLHDLEKQGLIETYKAFEDDSNSPQVWREVPALSIAGA